MQFKLDRKNLKLVDSCRTYGTELCDGFVCLAGNDCQSGCCGSMSGLKLQYCTPQVDEVCPADGIKYGFYGNTHPGSPKKKAAEPEDKEEPAPEEAPSKL